MNCPICDKAIKQKDDYITLGRTDRVDYTTAKWSDSVIYHTSCFRAAAGVGFFLLMVTSCGYCCSC